MNLENVNRGILATLRVLRKLGREAAASVAGQAFYCRALAGESDYNICVNSDMTVSCNCRDFDGLGRIGDLREESMEQIFASPRAAALRRALAAGRLPLLTCASCPELVRASRREAERRIHDFRPPSRGLMVENTVTCCYNCVSCYRRMVERNRKRRSMDLDDVRRVAGMLAAHRVRNLNFFNLGDPFAAPEVREQLRIIREANPEMRIEISTNGMMLDTDEKREAALLADRLIVSLDGVDDRTANRYQRGASFERVYGNMQELVRYRREQPGARKTRLEWKYVLFNWNDHPAQVRQAIDLARGAGLDAISFWPTRMPLYGISWRYRFLPFYRALGRHAHGYRVVDLLTPAT